MANTYALKFLTGAKAKYTALASKDVYTFYLVTNEDNSQNLYLGGMKLNNDDLSTQLAQIATNTGDISSIKSTLETLQGAVGVENSIRYLAKAAVDALDNDLAPIAKSGNAADVAVADSAGNFEAATKNVETVLAEIASKISTASSDAAVTVEKTVGGEDDDFVTKYTFKQGGTPITGGEITIGKDMVATSGELVHPTVDDPITVDGFQKTSGAFIKMTIANGTPFYIEVTELIEYNSVESTDEIELTDTNHKISATIKEVSGSKLTDGTVTKAKLHSDVQASLGKADTAIQASDLVASAVQYKAASGEDSAVSVEDALDANAQAVSDLDAKVGFTPGTGESDPKTLKAYVDAKVGSGVDALNGTAGIATVAEGVVTIKGGVTETSGVISNTAGASDVVLHKVATTGAAADVSINNAKFPTANTVDEAFTAVDTAIGDAKTALIGTASDTKDKDTVNGAKAYAKDAIAEALVWTEME